MAGGGKQPGAGRPKGSPNKATADVRKAIAILAQKNIGKLQGWLNRVGKEDPEKAAKLLLDAIEYHIPKQARTVVAGDPDDPLDMHWTVTVVRPK